MMIRQAIERNRNVPLKKVSYCRRCGRLLENTASVTRGYGYKCWKKIEAEKNLEWDGRDIAFKSAYQLLKEESKTLVQPFNKDDLFQHE